MPIDMEITLAVLADFASVSAEGKLNVMGIWDQVKTRQMPAQVLSPYLVMHLEANITEVEQPRLLRIQLVDADGRQLLAGEQQITINRPTEAGVTPSFNVISRFPALQFPQPGLYKFAISIDTDHKRDISLRVNLVTQAEVRPDDSSTN
ncbi:MAG: hypothetical protein O3B04_05045 [Chloroflexi bacterium]|nr:hypothetical protein [Chloroflexota bacterium]MDA1297355.1 hypothetical protein [Chloroflexota bacterium]